MTPMNQKVCHLSTIHPTNDIRIFHKECRTLAQAGYETHYVTVGSFEDFSEDGVQIHGVNVQSRRRWRRFSLSAYQVYKKALELDCDLYHLHTLDLLPYIWALKAKGKKVIYDAHEDQPRQTLSREFIPKSFRKIIAGIIEILEWRASRKIDGVVAATPFIRDRFLKLNKNSISATNYPVKFDFVTAPDGITRTIDFTACYVGSMNRVRGLMEMVRACERAKVGLLIAGGIDQKFRELVQRERGWKRVTDLGTVDRKGVIEIFSRAHVGFVLYHPEPNHVNAVPNKIFEYLAAGIPIIASNFPGWKKLIEEEKCGFAVEPTSISEISKALDYLRKNPKEAQAMGNRGRKAVLEKYTWETEANRLIQFYEFVLTPSLKSTREFFYVANRSMVPSISMSKAVVNPYHQTESGKELFPPERLREGFAE